MASLCKATVLNYFLGQETVGQPDLLRTEGQILLSYTPEFTIHIYSKSLKGHNTER